MVRSAGGKRATGRDMTKSLVKSHVEGHTARHATPVVAPRVPKAAKGKKAAKR